MHDLSLSDIKIPQRISNETIFFGIFMIAFQTWFIYRQEWLQAGFYAVIVSIYIWRAIWVYQTNGRALRLFKTLKAVNDALKEINETPVLREEGNSIIFTYLLPSPKLMKELEKLKNEHK